MGIYVTREMNRIKALYRSWAIPCAGATVYSPNHHAEWLAKIAEPRVRVRAERLYQQLDLLQPVRLEARRELLAESQEHSAVKLLRQIPSIDRTTVNIVPLAASCTLELCYQQQRKLMRMGPYAKPLSDHESKGAGYRDRISSGRGGAFFLTSLFISLVELS
jgi:hypothetical protein